jgi:hypothetical protein
MYDVAQQWQSNPHILFVLARDGMLRLFDTHSCTALHVSRPVAPPVLEAQVDTERYACIYVCI